MKKVLFFMSFFLLLGMTSNAQTAKKACCASKNGKKVCSKTAAVKAEAGTDTKVASASMSRALVAAEGNENIKTRECAETGATSFYEKTTCEKSGNISWTQVEFDEATSSFTQVASASMEREVTELGTKDAAPAKACCTKGSKSCSKATCSKGSKASCSKKSASCAKKATSSAEMAPKKVEAESKKVGI